VQESSVLTGHGSDRFEHGAGHGHESGRDRSQPRIGSDPDGFFLNSTLSLAHAIMQEVR
jgi:hypothetical protein